MTIAPRPEYSIIVPAWNEEAVLPATLGALQAAIEDIGRPAELIVVDDASTDRTAEVARACGARVERVEKRQISAVRNAGAAVAAGRYLVFVDADTLAPAETIRAALGELDDGAAGGGARVDFDEVPGFGAQSVWALFCLVWHRLGYAAGCFVYARRDAFEAVGGFDESVFAGEEVWISRALMARGRFVIVTPPVLTSGRKMRLYGTFGLLLRALGVALKGPGGTRTRNGLGVWYEGRREDSISARERE